MLNLGGIFTVVLAALVMVTAKKGSPLRNRDIEDFIKFLKEQQSDNESTRQVESSASDTTSDEDSVSDNIYGLLKNMEVIDLIEKANQGQSTSKSIKRNKNRIEKHTHQPVYRNYEINRHKAGTKRILEQLLKRKDTAHLKKQRHHRLTPNNLLGPTTLLDDVRQDVTDDDNGAYSKLFVILNANEIQKSHNKANLANLVSKILSLSSASNEKARLERNKSNLYKGFKVKNNLFSRRYRRESKESRDSAEDDFRPKRSRNDHNGGSGGGRTAIPYIRQRGDIYERDH